MVEILVDGSGRPGICTITVFCPESGPLALIVLLVVTTASLPLSSMIADMSNQSTRNMTGQLLRFYAQRVRCL